MNACQEREDVTWSPDRGEITESVRGVSGPVNSSRGVRGVASLSTYSYSVVLVSLASAQACDGSL